MGKSRFSRNWSKVLFQITTKFLQIATGITHYDTIITNYDIINTQFDTIITNYDRTHRINIHYASIDKMLSELELRAVRVQRVWAQQHYSIKLGKSRISRNWSKVLLHITTVFFITNYHKVLTNCGRYYTLWHNYYKLQHNYYTLRHNYHKLRQNTPY